MEDPEMGTCSEEQQRMLTDAFDMVISKLDPEGPEYELARVMGCFDPPLHCIVTITEFLASVIRAGLLEWKDLPSSWINSIPLAKCVFKENLRPYIMYLDPGQESRQTFSWTDLPDVCRSNVDVVLIGIKCYVINRWEDIPLPLQSNSDVAMEAWKHILRWNEEYYTRLSSVAPILNCDSFRSCIEQEKIEDWDDLPPEYRDNIDFARSIRFFPSESVAFSIFNCFPDLCEEQETWSKLLESSLNGYYTRKLLDIFAPIDILSDHNFMLRACQYDSVLICVELPLAHDRSFLTEVLDRYPDQLAHLHHDVQLMFPDLFLSYLSDFVRCLPPLSQGVEHSANIRRLALALHSSFWSEHNNLMAWFLAGLPRPHSMDESIILSDVVNADAELMILIASHGDKDLRTESFSFVSPSLRNNKSFMRKAIKCDPFLFCCASETLQMDFDLALLVFGTSYEAYVKFARQPLPESMLRFLESFFGIVEDKLSAHHLFADLFLFGIAQPQCFLSMLGQGHETSQSFKKTIAEYLDVPIGRELRLLRFCANLPNAVR
jgi:Domain of unknown function (DUF4116)